MGSLLKYKFNNWKLRWEKPLHSSYLALPSQKILPCKRLCFWECWETTLGPLPPWLESAVLGHQGLNICRWAASTDVGLVDVGNMVYIYCIHWTKSAPCGFGDFYGFGGFCECAFLQGEVVGVFWLWFGFTLFPLRKGVKNSNERNMKIGSFKNAPKRFFILSY